MTLQSDLIRELSLTLKGGPGSGNKGHAGRPGKRGGSAPQAKFTKQINDPDFTRWFGDSKVVDESGKPIILFHGTQHGGFSRFDPKKSDPDALYGRGFYFTQDPEIASQYARDDLNDSEYLGYERQPETGEVVSALKVMKTHYEKLNENYPNNRDIEKSLKMTNHLIWLEEQGGFEDEISSFLENPLSYNAFGGGTPTGENVAKMIFETIGIKKGVKGGATVYPVFLSIKRPFDIDENLGKKDLLDIADAMLFFRDKHGGKYESYGFAFAVDKIRGKKSMKGASVWEAINLGGMNKDDIRDVIELAGFDGITHTGGRVTEGKRHKVWIAFTPKQVKSAVPNEGDYSPDNPDITKEFRERLIESMKGGPGSGNFEHAGRPGKRGGSGPSHGGKIKLAGSLTDWPDDEAEFEKFVQKFVAAGSKTPIDDLRWGLRGNFARTQKSPLIDALIMKKGISAVGLSHDIRLEDEPDARIAAEIINGLPEPITRDIRVEIRDKDLQEGATQFGSSGTYEPPDGRHSGHLELSIQSSNNPARKAWTVAHEFGHSYSITLTGRKTPVSNDPEILHLLGFSGVYTRPDPSVSITDMAPNRLQKYCGGPDWYYVNKKRETTPWTSYGYNHPEEAFAEAFAGYMVSPKSLRRDRPKLYNWMKDNIFHGAEYEGYADEPPRLMDF
jgi:hypothetical protein